MSVFKHKSENREKKERSERSEKRVPKKLNRSHSNIDTNKTKTKAKIKKNQLQVQLNDNKLKMDKARLNIQQMKAELRANRYFIKQFETNIQDLIRDQQNKQQTFATKKEFENTIKKYEEEITVLNEGENGILDLENAIIKEKEKLQTLNEQRKHILIESSFVAVLDRIDQVKEKAARLYNVNFIGLDAKSTDNAFVKSLMMIVMKSIESVESEIKNFTRSETMFDSTSHKKIKINVNANKFNFKQLEKTVERAIEDMQIVHSTLEQMKGMKEGQGKQLIHLQTKILHFVKELQRIFEDVFRDIKQMGKEIFVPERVAAEDRLVREKLESNRSLLSTKTSYQTQFKDKLMPESFTHRLQHSVKSMAKQAKQAKQQTKQFIGTKQQTQEHPHETDKLESTYMGELLKGYRSKFEKGKVNKDVKKGVLGAKIESKNAESKAGKEGGKKYVAPRPGGQGKKPKL